MNQPVSKRRSPTAPSIGLDEAINRALMIYDNERCYPAPMNAVTQHIGFKAVLNNPAAFALITAMSHYGLVESPEEGMLAVSRELELYKNSHNEQGRQQLLLKWLKTPAIFAELLEKYPDSLPSRTTLKFDLIQRGFTPPGADACMQVFQNNLDFVKYFDYVAAQKLAAQSVMQDETASYGFGRDGGNGRGTTRSAGQADRMPIRLSGGRRAWVEIPTPFYASDKEQLLAQIELLVTDD